MWLAVSSSQLLILLRIFKKNNTISSHHYFIKEGIDLEGHMRSLLGKAEEEEDSGVNPVVHSTSIH